ncbi:hypothetical protein R5R73_03355 [Salinicola sp. LHM]|jgi:hypothetical protein|uniref:hypothetical protein n=1 Tax=Salinicola sp. LHM TaxID=3065298 RepID=UPI002ACDBEEC|nr:hypothetical protein [Salinicola sp. LHM]WQH33728.1 hypothetical protein R5R73_03355 [Salinicola sp. LHM]
MSMKGTMNTGLGLVLGAMLFGGVAMAQDKTSDQPNLDKQSGDQTNEQEDARETAVQQKGAPKLAQECRDLAVQKDEQSEEIDGKSIYETNAKNYKQGEEFELLVDLLGEGNAKYNLTCKIDADGNMSYEGMEKTSTVKSSPGGA